ncbi:hypothetical protein LCGC14_2674290, partial [marine sediment metagenome]
MDKQGFFTTVVGSLPLNNTGSNMVMAFKDLIQIGVDYPCYPQLISMIDQFLCPLAENLDQMENEKNRYYLNSDFKIPKKPFPLEYGEFIVDFFNNNPQLLKKIKGTKACLTGPFTLATEILLKGEISKGIKPRIFAEPRAIMVDWIVEKIAEILKQLGKSYSEMGIDIISMDEPSLGLLVGRKTLFHSEDFFIKIINKAISGIENLSSIHVCGRISPFLRDLLLKSNVRILDHEFTTIEENFEIFQKEHFADTDKYLALGTVNSKFVPTDGWEVKDYIEDLDYLESYIRKAIEIYGKE